MWPCFVLTLSRLGFCGASVARLHVRRQQHGFEANKSHQGVTARRPVGRAPGHGRKWKGEAGGVAGELDFQYRGPG